MSVDQTSRNLGKTAPADFAGQPPYRGLARYEEDDEKRFFGREDMTELLAFLAEQRSDLPLMLVGASGAGKSSLLRAGLLPRLRAAAEAASPGDGERVAVYDLHGTGIAEVTDAVRAAAQASGSSGASGASGWGLAGTTGAWGRGGTPGGVAAVIVDQFEAVFTQAADEAERSALIAALCELAQGTLVVLALRAECYGQAIGYPGLLRALRERQVVLGPMTAGQVCRVVEEPARLAGTNVADGLAEAVLADLNGGLPADSAAGTSAQAYGPGALPLLSHALLSAWRRRDGDGQVSVDAYRGCGGVGEALPQSAERAYAGLSHGQRRLARRLLPRLVRQSDGLPPSRVPVPLSELRGGGAEGSTADVGRILAAFAGERIITLDAGTARLTHDVVLTGWPRLRGWLAEGARGGTRTGPERRYRRRAGWLAGAVVVLMVLALAAGGLAAHAFSLRQRAVTAGNAAAAAGQAANSRAVAFVADRTRGTDPATAAQLAAAAYAISPTPQATASLLDAAGTTAVARIEDSADAVRSVSASPNGRVLTAAGVDGSLRLWNIAVPGHPVLAATLTAAGSGGQPGATAFSPDGSVIAVAETTAAGKSTVQLWRVTGNAAAPRVTAQGPPLAGPGGTVSSVAFGADGRLLAAGSANGTVRLWKVSDPAHPVTDGQPLVLPGAGGRVTSVAFGDGGGVLAAGTSAGTAVLWKVEGAATPVRYTHMPLSGPGGSVSEVAFSPDGRTLAAAGAGGGVRLWSVRAGTGAKNKGAAAVSAGTLTAGGASGAGAASAVAFSPDGTSLAAGGSAGVLVWSLAIQAVTATVPQPQPVTSLTWAGADQVTAATAGGTLALIALPSPVLVTGNRPASVAYSPDGTTVAVGGASVQLWDAAKRTLLATHPLAAGVTVRGCAFTAAAGKPVLAVALSDGTVALLDGRKLTALAKPFPVTAGAAAAAAGSVAFSADGSLLVTGASDGSVRLYDVSRPASPRKIAVVHAAGGAVATAAITPDGTAIAVASADGAIRRWHVGGGGVLTAEPSLGPVGGYAIGLAFSPGGRLLAAGGDGSAVHLWNLADPAHAVPLGALAGPSGHVWAVAFSPSGTTLAAGATDGTVWLWNLASPARPVLTAALNGPAGHVSGLAFAPSGDRLAAVSADSGVQLRVIRPAAARAAVCANLGQPLTHSQWAGYVPGVPYQAAC